MSEPLLPLPPGAHGPDGGLVVSTVWRAYSPPLFEARQVLDAAVEQSVDPVLREVMRLRNARSLSCEH
jgi:hypothetical protein